MISDKVRAALEKQIGSEFSASQYYMAVGVWFGLQSLDGWRDFFFAQSDEEREHGYKIVKFLTELDAAFKLPAVSEVKPSFKSPAAVLDTCLKQEQGVTESFHKMAALAVKEGDFTSFQFLQWFIEEQVEEEALFRRLIDLVKSGINIFQAEEFLTRDES